MRGTITLTLALLVSTAASPGQETKVTPGAGTGAPAPPSTVASVVGAQISRIERLVTEAAEAMPEEKFDFSPESLHIPGSRYDGVRTFAQQVRHIAASNYAIWAPLTSEAIPADFKGGNGPETLKSRAEILRFLKDSFALGERAAALLTPDDMLQPAATGKPSRLHLATFAVAHAYDHYGQMVEYLRMNGIVPPASRAKSD